MLAGAPMTPSKGAQCNIACLLHQLRHTVKQASSLTLCAATAEVSKPGQTLPELPESAGEESIRRMDALRFANGERTTAQIRGALQRTMQNDAAVFRRAVS